MTKEERTNLLVKAAQHFGALQQHQEKLQIMPPQECYEMSMALVALRDELANAEPMFYVRLRSDGGYEGPIHADSIEAVRVKSGAWKPLYLAPKAAIPEGWKLVPVEPTEAMAFAPVTKTWEAHRCDECGNRWESGISANKAREVWRYMLSAASTKD